MGSDDGAKVGQAPSAAVLGPPPAGQITLPAKAPSAAVLGPPPAGMSGQITIPAAFPEGLLDPGVRGGAQGRMQSPRKGGAGGNSTIL